MPSGSSLLVTGGLGFIGSHFLRWWHARHPDDRLVNLDAHTYAADAARVADVRSSDRYTLVRGDIVDATLVGRLAREADYVVHFAAESHVDRSIADPAAFLQTNAVGTQVLLEAARRANVRRFHHVSTDEVFGQLPLGTRETFREDSPYRPRSPYAASKAAADHVVRAYHATYGMDVTITNGSNNYGPWQHPEKLIPRLAISALLGEPLPVYGTGRNVRDWVHVEDYCAAIELVVTKGKAGQTYCVGGDAQRANVDIARSVCELTRRPTSLIRFVPDRPGHDLRYAVDASKIRSELGWAPRASFESGLAATVEWFRAHEAWWRPLRTTTEKTYADMADSARTGGVR